VTDTDAYAPHQVLRVALEITPSPGWHTYWHDPGDAGAATDFSIAATGGGAATVGPMRWPLPQRLVDGPVTSFGYAGPVLLLRSLRLAGSGPITLTAHADWLVCNQICVPEHAVLSLDLPQGAPGVSAEGPAIAAAEKSVPGPAPWAAHIAPDGTLFVPGLEHAGPAQFLPDQPDTTVLAAVQTLSNRSGMALKLTPTALFRKDAPLSGVLVLGAGADRVGYRIDATPAPLPAADTAEPVGAGLLTTLVLAFGGGLLLNLMPCVFPVLAMKAVGLAALGGQARRAVRMHAAAYTAGVMLSFAGIGVLLLVLRAAGQAAGWGFQFQWPPFVAAMAWLFFGIGLNLSGAFSIGGGWMGAGQGLTRREGTLGSFATGLLAVLVATPCTAPFMGAAVAAAVTAAPAVALATFLALGLGFSLPWTVLAFVPSLAGRLPRPGAWMEWLRQALAFPMYAAAVWLVWVLSEQAGSFGVLFAGAGLVLIGFAAFVRRWGDAQDGGGRQIGRALSLAVVLGVIGLLPVIARIKLASVTRTAAAETYSPARLAALRKSGQPVLVNMTASWCVTCLVNERVAIEPALPALRAQGVAYLTGDWTRADPAISAFLRRYRRDGVPLYVFFPSGWPLDKQGEVLPQILTPHLIEALK
jgi:DsbC/DsbD-like thiol-disulfide interchange protein/cytochrome c biogenesis protein CcdA